METATSRDCCMRYHCEEHQNEYNSVANMEDSGSDGTSDSKQLTSEFLDRIDNFVKYDINWRYTLTLEEFKLIRHLFLYISMNEDDKTGKRWLYVERKLRDANYKQLETLSALVLAYNKATCVLANSNTIRRRKVQTGISYWILERKSRTKMVSNKYFKKTMANAVDIEKLSGKFIHFLVNYNEIDFLQVLCERGMNLNIQFKGGETLFSIAVKNNNAELVAMMMYYNVDPHIPDNDLSLPYELAIQCNFHDMADMILEYGLDRHSIIRVDLVFRLMFTDNWDKFIEFCDESFQVYYVHSDYWDRFVDLPYERLKQFTARYFRTKSDKWFEETVKEISGAQFDGLWRKVSRMDTLAEKHNFLLLWHWFAEIGVLALLIDSLDRESELTTDVLASICRCFQENGDLSLDQLEETILLFVQHNASISHRTINMLYHMNCESLCFNLISMGTEYWPDINDPILIGYMQMFLLPDMANLTKVLSRPETMIYIYDIKRLLMMSSHPKLLNVASGVNDPEVDAILVKRLNFPSLREIAEHRAREVLINQYNLKNWAQLYRVVTSLVIPDNLKVALLMMYTTKHLSLGRKSKTKRIGWKSY